MYIVTITGTARPGSYTGKAVRYLNGELEREGFTVKHIDLAETKLYAPGVNGGDSQADELKELVAGAGAVIIATPEYHGSFAGSLKILLENLGFPSVLAGKHVAMLGVAAGVIGAVKSLEQLRVVLSHIGSFVLPMSVSVPRVQTVFTEVGEINDTKTGERILGMAHKLFEFAGIKVPVTQS